MLPTRQTSYAKEGLPRQEDSQAIENTFTVEIDAACTHLCVCVAHVFVYVRVQRACVYVYVCLCECAGASSACPFEFATVRRILQHVGYNNLLLVKKKVVLATVRPSG